MDKITLRLSPSRKPGMTRFQLDGDITTRLGARDVTRLWQLLEQLSERVCIALPVDAPLGWFDLWCGRLGGARASQLAIRFVLSGRRRVHDENEVWTNATWRDR